MQIIGHGFLARHLARIAGSHPDAVVLAAGVTRTGCTDMAEFARETALLHRVLERCAGQGHRLVFLSTASTGMYGGAEPGSEDQPVTTPSDYGRHKRALERTVSESGVDHLVLRLSHVTGPHQPPHQLVPALIRQIREGKVVIHQGASRDLIDAADAVLLIDRLLTLGVSHEIVNVASGVHIPIEQVVDHLEARLGIAASHEPGPVAVPNTVSIDKLRGLVADCPDFPRGYPRTVLDRYLTSAGIVSPAVPAVARRGHSVIEVPPQDRTPGVHAARATGGR